MTTVAARKIQDLKKSLNAVVLAHYYQLPEVQDIADFVGDSLDLSRRARDADCDTIVFCGVRFMAETARILNPGRTVLLPAKEAGCPMADMVTASDIEQLRREHPGAAVVCYVNSSAEVKAASDICCTSSNAVAVARSLGEKEIIFVPDRNLGHFVSRFLPDKKIILYEGCCPVHAGITAVDVDRARLRHPGAKVLVHPECAPEVIDKADYASSTSQIISHASASAAGEFIIGTESGILHRLTQLCPDKKFHLLRSSLQCPDMKLTTLAGLCAAMAAREHPVEPDNAVMARAAVALDRMLRI